MWLVYDIFFSIQKKNGSKIWLILDLDGLANQMLSRIRMSRPHMSQNNKLQTGKL